MSPILMAGAVFGGVIFLIASVIGLGYLVTEYPLFLAIMLVVMATSGLWSPSETDKEKK